EALAYHTAWLTSRPGDYDPEVRTRLQLGAFVTGAHYVKGQQVRALVRRDVDAALARRDVLLAPATPLTAPRLDERQTTLGDGASEVRSALIRLTRPFNFSGHPACAVPCGFSAPSTAGSRPRRRQARRKRRSRRGSPSTCRCGCSNSCPRPASIPKRRWPRRWRGRCCPARAYGAPTRCCTVSGAFPFRSCVRW